MSRRSSVAGSEDVVGAAGALRRQVRRRAADMNSVGICRTSRRRARRRRPRSAWPVICSAARLKRDDPAGPIGRDQTARQALDDVLIECLQVGQCRATRPRAGRRRGAGDRPATRRAAPRPQARWRWPPRCRPPRASAAGTAACRASTPRRCTRAARCTAASRARRTQALSSATRMPPGAELHRGRADDRQHVQQREVAGHAAGEVYERRDDAGVARRTADRPATASARRSRIVDRVDRRSGRRSGR